MEKKLFTMMLILLAMTAVCVCGCSSDDTPVEQAPEVGESEEKDSIEVDTVEVFTPSPAVNNGEPVSVSYRTLNIDGVETSEFKEGENVILDLTIYNNTDEDIPAGEMHDFLYSAFLVYSSDGSYVGAAYDTSVMMNYVFKLESGKAINWHYPWMHYPAATTWFPFANTAENENKPLPVGDYYSEFKLHLDNFEDQTYKAEFSVR